MIKNLNKNTIKIVKDENNDDFYAILKKTKKIKNSNFPKKTKKKYNHHDCKSIDIINRRKKDNFEKERKIVTRKTFVKPKNEAVFNKKRM